MVTETKSVWPEKWSNSDVVYIFDDDPREKRYKILQVHAQFLVELWRGPVDPNRWFQVVNEYALPADAEVLSVQYDGIRDVWNMAISSESYPIVREGEEAPIMPAMVIRGLIHTRRKGCRCE